MLYKNSIQPSSTMVAIYPPEHILKPLKPYFSKEVWDNGPHVTLAYLGKTNKGQFIDLAICLNKATFDLDPLELRIEGAGCFRGDDSRIKLALVNGPGLDRWSMHVREILAKEGFLPPEDHGFLPHMTLSYEKGFLEEGWEQPMINQTETWTCNSFVLNRGHDSKMIYEVKES